jgi:hypothetical protein
VGRLWLAMVFMAIGAGACQKQTAKPFGAGQVRPAPTVVAVCETRPEWWSDTPVTRGGVLSVCAGAEDRDLLSARRRAVETATQRFVTVTGKTPSEPELQADSVRLGDGTFRAFVRLSAHVP